MRSGLAREVHALCIQLPVSITAGRTPSRSLPSGAIERHPLVVGFGPLHAMLVNWGLASGPCRCAAALNATCRHERRFFISIS